MRRASPPGRYGVHAYVELCPESLFHKDTGPRCFPLFARPSRNSLSTDTNQKKADSIPGSGLGHIGESWIIYSIKLPTLSPQLISLLSTARMITEPEGIKTSPPEKLKGFEWWRRSMQYRTGISLTNEEKAQFEHDYRAKYMNMSCQSCEQYRDWMFQFSPSVRFMMDHVKRLGGNLSAKNIVCEECDDLKGGGFHPQYGILLCSNRMTDKWQLEDVMAHELVHAYDHLKFEVDPSNLRHHACTEIRASMLSGECRIMNEIQKTGMGGFGGKFQDCIRRRATLSVAANPACKNDEEARRVVNTVWSSCFNDTRPYERVYR